MNSLTTFFKIVPEGLKIYIKVIPGASKTRLGEIYMDKTKGRLKIYLKESALEGKANAALQLFFSDVFNISKQAILVVAGTKSREKTLLLKGGVARLLEVVHALI